MQKKDIVFFYHSNTQLTGIAGIVKISKTSYPDHTALDPNSDHPDPKSAADNPRGFMADAKFKKIQTHYLP